MSCVTSPANFSKGSHLLKGRHWTWGVVWLGVLLAVPVKAQQDPTNVLPVAVPDTATKAAAVTADAVQEAFVRVAERIKPSVVTISAERLPKPAAERSAPPESDKAPGKPGDKSPKPDDRTPKPSPEDDEEAEDDAPFPFGPRDPSERSASLGTGVIVRSDGYVLTNYHVVKGAGVIRVIFNADSERPDRPIARLLGFDEESDLAVLKVDRTGLQAVDMADSDQVRIGEWALAVGAPFDQAQSVTVGVVSAKGRHLNKDDGPSLQDYIQTDASINPGNSGGPLVNLQGQVIGINTAILSPSRFNVGIGFAVPSNTVRQYLPRLLLSRRIERGFLGIQYVGLDKDVAREFGVPGGMQIGALYKKDGKFVGPAKEAGLQEGDIITAVNGQPVESSDDFRRIVSNSPPGTKILLDVVRPTDERSEKHAISLTLGDRPGQAAKETELAGAAPQKADVSRLGVEVENVDKLKPLDRELFGLNPQARGAVITNVVPGSSADDAELRRGLRIVRLRVSGGTWQTIANKAAFLQLEKTLKPGARVLMQLRDREDVSIYKVIIMPGSPASSPTA